MREIASLLNGMVRDGVITSYAVFGAIAQTRYRNPIATLDVDVLVALPDPGSAREEVPLVSEGEDRVRELLERYRVRQRSLGEMSWPEKVRMAAAVRASVAELRGVPRTGGCSPERADTRGPASRDATGPSIETASGAERRTGGDRHPLDHLDLGFRESSKRKRFRSYVSVGLS